MCTLKQKATKFRNAIYRAKKHGDLDWHPIFAKFPDDCCDMTCDLPGQYLLESGIETYQINGINKYDSSWHHVWLVTTEGVIVDITGDQFVGKMEKLHAKFYGTDAYSNGKHQYSNNRILSAYLNFDTRIRAKKMTKAVPDSAADRREI